MKEQLLKKLAEKEMQFLGEIPKDIKRKEQYSFIDKYGYKYHTSPNNILDTRTKNYAIVSAYNKYTLENIQHYLDLHSQGSQLLSTKWEGEKGKLTLKCGKCGNIFKVHWNHIYSCKKFYCNTCGRNRGYDEKLKLESERICRKHGYKILPSTYKSRKCFDMIDKQGYKYSNCNITNLDTRSNRHSRIHQNNKYQVENAKLYLKLNNIPVKIDFQGNFSTRKDYLTGYCIECGKPYKVRWGNLVGQNKEVMPQYRCQKCNGKQSGLEYTVEQYLIEQHIQYIMQKRFTWCQDKRMLPFDFYLPEHNAVIEVQGCQHYYHNYFNRGLDWQQQRDEFKKQCCIRNNIKYLAIPFWRITGGTFDKMIQEMIK